MFAGFLICDCWYGDLTSSRKVSIGLTQVSSDRNGGGVRHILLSTVRLQPCRSSNWRRYTSMQITRLPVRHPLR